VAQREEASAKGWKLRSWGKIYQPQINADERGLKMEEFICVHRRSSAAINNFFTPSELETEALKAMLKIGFAFAGGFAGRQ